jgi:hypothetical protein
MSGGAGSSGAEAHSGNESSSERELDAVGGLCHDPRFKNLCGTFHSARSRHSGLARRRGLDLGTFDDLVHDVKLMRFASGLSTFERLALIVIGTAHTASSFVTTLTRELTGYRFILPL